MRKQKIVSKEEKKEANLRVRRRRSAARDHPESGRVGDSTWRSRSRREGKGMKRRRGSRRRGRGGRGGGKLGDSTIDEGRAPSESRVEKGKVATVLPAELWAVILGPSGRRK